jgi:PAS domain S-box-containing protein
MTEPGVNDPIELVRGPGLHAAGRRELLRALQELQMQAAEAEIQADALRRVQNELELAHERYFEIYELAPVGYATLDAEGRIEVANLTLTRLLGIERSRLVGTRLVDRMSEADRRRYQQFFENALRASSKPSTFETTLRSACGALPVMLEVAASETRAQTLRVAIIDLSRLEQARNTAREREARLRAVLDTVADGILIVDELGKIVSCNAAATALLRTSAAWLIGQPASGVLPGFGRVEPGLRQELTGIRSDDTRLPVEVAVTTLRIGGAVQRVAVVTDISERKRRDLELHEALERFRQMADHLDDAIFIAEAPSGAPLYVSPAYDKIFGRPAAGEPGEAWPYLRSLHPDDRERMQRVIEELLTRGGTIDEQFRVVRPDGAVRTVRCRASMLGEQRRVTGILHDMTEELTLQAELRQAQRLEAIGTLASGIAHDFNNLLMGVGGCAQLALRRLDPEHPAYVYVRRAADAILRGANLTRQILRFNDTRRSAEEPIELDAVIIGSRDLVQSLVGEQIEFSIVAGAPGLSVATDAGDIEQVLLNVASNARDAMPNGGLLTLRTEPQQGGMVKLTVRDTGTGMSEETKRRIFEPFFTTKEVGKGTGLGLSTVFAIVRRMGGTITADSVLGEGTTFTLMLPVVITVPNEEASSPYATQGDGQTILIVDDDPLIRMTVETHVEALGYRALTAASVPEALKVYGENPRPVDLVLTDVMMPGLLGSDLGRILQKSAPGLAVIYMSAHPWHELVAKGLVTDKARLLSKPFGTKELGAALGHALENSPGKGRVPVRVFVVDDDPDVTDTLQDLLRMDGYEVETARTTKDALSKIPLFDPDIVLSDINVDGPMSGLALVSQLRKDERLARTAFVAVTGLPPTQCRPAALAAGFQDVLTKPLDFEQLSKMLASRARR